MNCPKCQSAMDEITYEAVTIDRCSACGGLWFDLLEASDLKARAGSQAVDRGDRAVGAQHDAQDAIDCPRCDVAMLRMVDAQQPHIWYEACPVCHGTYFDAGEFADLKDAGPFEFMKRIRKGPRA